MVLCSIPNISIVPILFCYSTFSLIGSVFIDPGTCPWVLSQIVCDPYQNCTYRFNFPTGLSKFVAMVPVYNTYYLALINKLLYKME